MKDSAASGATLCAEGLTLASSCGSHFISEGTQAVGVGALGRFHLGADPGLPTLGSLSEACSSTDAHLLALPVAVTVRIRTKFLDVVLQQGRALCCCSDSKGAFSCKDLQE